MRPPDKNPFATGAIMNTAGAQTAATPPQLEMIGRVAHVTGSQATVELNSHVGNEHPTVGKYMGLVMGKAIIIGMITEVGEPNATRR
jgi:hypothetical protein